LPKGRPGGAVSQYPEFGLSYQSIQDALADVVQAEAGTARSSNTKGVFMELTRAVISSLSSTSITGSPSIFIAEIHS
jgi:hypothetical protein